MNRKKFIKTSLIVAGVAVTGKFLFAKKHTIVMTTFTSNPVLKTVNSDWKGTPLDQNGLFMNDEFPFIHSYTSALKWMTEKNPYREQKKKDKWRIPVIKNDEFVKDESDKIVWLGHASFYIQISGIRLLIDPVLGKLTVGNRYSELPILPEKLVDIDYILVLGYLTINLH